MAQVFAVWPGAHEQGIFTQVFPFEPLGLPRMNYAPMLPCNVIVEQKSDGILITRIAPDCSGCRSSFMMSLIHINDILGGRDMLVPYYRPTSLRINTLIVRK
jgi:hypothetical protein